MEQKMKFEQLKEKIKNVITVKKNLDLSHIQFFGEIKIQKSFK